MAHRGLTIDVVGSYLSPFVRKVLAAAYLKNLSYTIDPINPFYANDDFRKLSPLGRVPLVFHGTDVVLSDSTVICEYLDEAFPDRGSKLYPDRSGDPAVRAQARLCEELGDTRFADVLIWQLWFELAIAKGVWGKAPDMQIVERTVTTDIPQLLQYLTTNLLPMPCSCVSSGGFLFGPEISMGDIGLCVSFGNMLYLKYDIAALYQKTFPDAVNYVLRVLRHPSLTYTEAFQVASLRGKTADRRQNCIEAGAPVSTTRNYGTLAAPRSFTD